MGRVVLFRRRTQCAVPTASPGIKASSTPTAADSCQTTARAPAGEIYRSDAQCACTVFDTRDASVTRPSPAPALAGGSKSARNGSAGYEARTAVNGGSELLIFVRPKASDCTAESGMVAVGCCGTKEGCAMAGDVFERLHDAQNTHDLGAFLACFDSDYRSDQPVHPDRAFAGSEQVRRNWAAVFDGVPDFRAELVRSAQGEDATWQEWYWHEPASTGHGWRCGG